ncbi:MAG: DUF4845 domain-containing protein [Rhodocyclaceae bacterium]|nr:DUF4845 domain-containing protein [Rhodocyclaceae bacterium]
MKRQKGMTLIGLLLTGIGLALVFLLGMKTVPAVTEFAAVKRVINAVAESADPGTSTVPGIRKDFDLRATVDDIKSVRGADLDITKRSGRVEISVAYSRKVPLVANVSLLLEFEARSTGK